MNWLWDILIKRILDYVVSFFQKEAAAIERTADQKKKDEENRVKYEAALASGDKAAIEKAAEDLLNGN